MNRLTLCRWISVVVAIYVLVIAADLRAEEVRNIPGSGQLYSDAVASAMKDDARFLFAAWPSEAELAQALDPSVVPHEVREKAVEWVRTILRNDLVPSDLGKRFIALRRRVPYIPPQEVDYLIARYQIGNYQVQIMEDGATIGILVNPLNIERTSGVEAYIKKAAEKFLNLPPGVSKRVQLRLQTVSLRGGGTLCRGLMQCDYKPLMKNRAWWNESFVWSDGKLFFYHAIERTGKEPPGLPQARPGIRPRFKR